MPYPQHVEILRSGLPALMQWQMENPSTTLDLEHADLRRLQLRDAMLVGANLSGAELTDADLSDSSFMGSDFTKAELFRAKLVGSELHGVAFVGADLRWADLENADLRSADLSYANLEHAKLKGADLSGAKLIGANLHHADLDNANLYRADVTGADLRAARLRDTYVGEIHYEIHTMRCAGVHASTCFGNPFFKRDVEDQDWLEHFALVNPKLYALWKYTSDCGRCITRVVCISALLALFFGLVYAQKTIPLIAVKGTEDTWFAPFYYSIVTFTTLGFGDITPLNLAGQFVVVTEVVLGYVALGILVSILANKVARRA
ncbi:MAG: pentapeptide repeat-containing protein [Planctomycetes bacterium]|nr:pentapeptide repeat-containing protein [Planctomycetota bacterium]MCB9917607.1 pentapeptide repeat-containing protein [Planctomycetota bacterium]